jgi:hypothetical protein
MKMNTIPELRELLDKTPGAPVSVKSIVLSLLAPSNGSGSTTSVILTEPKWDERCIREPILWRIVNFPSYLLW